MKFILGKKIEMTQIWQGDKAIAVTKVQAGPCQVVQVKNNEKDGYQAVQIGFGEKKEKNIKKPQKNHLKGLGNFRYLREFKIETDDLKKGDKIDINTFESGDTIKVTGISKGKGFQGVVKRHGFHGQSKTHGTKDQVRMPGSIGATGPAHVFKGQKMPGRMGGDRVTVTNLEVAEVDEKNNILLISGAIPGARNGLILISGPGELKKVSASAEASADKEVRSLPAKAVRDQGGQGEKSEEKKVKDKEEVRSEKSEGDEKQKTENEKNKNKEGDNKEKNANDINEKK